MCPIVSVLLNKSFSLNLESLVCAFQQAYRQVLPPSGWLWSRHCVWLGWGETVIHLRCVEPAECLHTLTL